MDTRVKTLSGFPKLTRKKSCRDCRPALPPVDSALTAFARFAGEGNQGQAMNEDILIGMIKDLHGEVLWLRSGEVAMQRILNEIAPMLPPEAAAVFQKYEAYRQERREEILLELEKTAPGLAAELDKSEPLMPPDEPNP